MRFVLVDGMDDVFDVALYAGYGESTELAARRGRQSGRAPQTPRALPDSLPAGQVAARARNRRPISVAGV